MRRSFSALLLAFLLMSGASAVLLAFNDERALDVPEAALAPGGQASPAPAAQAAQPPSAPQAPAKPEAAAPQTRKFVAPIRGVAEIGYLKPVTKVVGNEVVTTIRIKNLSNAPIAGLRVDEFWFDAQGNPLPSDYEILKKPLMPGEVVEIELRVPKNPKMNRNQYQFRHANGQIKPRLMQKF
jgi:hypothetical protein